MTKAAEPSIAVLVTGDPVPLAHARRGSFADLIRQAAGDFERHPWAVYDARELDVLPELTDALGIIVTGSALSVTDGLPWMERLASHLRQHVASGVPVLGICFGHQLLGHALGGRVGRNPRGREIGSVELDIHEPDPLLGPLGRVVINSTHMDSVLELPQGAQVVASTAMEPHAVVRFGPSTWGVQFHPEIDAEVMRYYLEARRSTLLEEGVDVDALGRGVRDTPAGSRVIASFLRLAYDRSVSLVRQAAAR